MPARKTGVSAMTEAKRKDRPSAGGFRSRSAPGALSGFPHVRKALPAAGELSAAIDILSRSGVLTEGRSRKLSVRVDPGPFDLLAERLGTDNPTEIVNAALAMAAAPDRFKIWLMTTGDRLPDDFELPV